VNKHLHLNTDNPPRQSLDFRSSGKVYAFFMQTMPTLTRTATGLRLFAICFVAISVSLPMAWISLGRLVLFASCLAYLIFSICQNIGESHANKLWSVPTILLILTIFGLSVIWTEAPTYIALQTLAKHGKLIEIAMMVVLIRNLGEARLALTAFFASQAFFVASSWIMAAGLRIPWATSAQSPEYHTVVYSTYLDQTLIFAAAAGVLWHLRKEIRHAAWLAPLFAVLAGTNNLFLQEGRTGYLATSLVLTLAIMWEFPRRWRVAVFLVFPALIGAGLYAGSETFQSRVAEVIHESQSYVQKGNETSSSGFRLNAWHRSLQAIAEKPLIGHGVGSWTQTVKHIEGANANLVFGTAITSNPHQEFLMWGVELGLTGTLMLVMLIWAIARDALKFDASIQRAVWSVLAVMVVGCLFNSSLYDSLIGDFFCVTLGLLLALGVRSVNQTTLDDPTAADTPDC
jgi:O-antigen ligase